MQEILDDIKEDLLKKVTLSSFFQANILAILISFIIATGFNWILTLCFYEHSFSSKSNVIIAIISSVVQVIIAVHAGYMKEGAEINKSAYQLLKSYSKKSPLLNNLIKMVLQHYMKVNYRQFTLLYTVYHAFKPSDFI